MKITFAEFLDLKNVLHVNDKFKSRYASLNEIEKKEHDHTHWRYVNAQLDYDKSVGINKDNAEFYFEYLNPFNLPPHNPSAYRRNGLCDIVNKLFDFHGELNEPAV